MEYHDNGNNYNQNGYNPNGYNPNGYYQYDYNYPNNYNYSQQIYMKQAKDERRQIRSLGNIVGLTMCLYIVFQLMVSFGLLLNQNLYSLYLNSATFYYSFSMLAVSLLCVALPFGLMALLNKKKYVSSLIPSKSISFKNLCLWVGFGMLCCVVADYIVSIITVIFSSFGVDISSSEDILINSPFDCILCFLGLTVMPAICEEFAMRCCSIGLLRKYGKAFAVVSVSIMFGLLHMNITQFIFATIIGLILGFVTVKTDSIWPAVIIHMCNNAMSALSDIFDYIAGDSGGFISKINNNITYIFFIFWLVVGIAATIILAVKGNLKKEKTQSDNLYKNPYRNSNARKVVTFFCTPGMIIPFIFFIYYCVVSIS